MKNLFKLSTFLLSAVALFTVSCAEEAVDAPTPSNPNAISFTESIAALTKASDTAFDNGDAISVTAYSANGAVYAENVAYTYASSVFTSTSPISYSTTDTDPSLSFIAVYPATTSASDISFSISTDQSGTGYTASDLMSASTSLTNDSTPELTFYHRLSKVIFNLTFVNVEAKQVSATIEGDTSVSCDFSNNSYTSNGESATITMAGNGTNSYKAIVAPKTYSANDTLATITVDDVEYTVVLGADITFASGYQYSSSIKIEVAEDEEPEDTTITITFDGVGASIEDWGSEEITDNTTVETETEDDDTTEGDDTVEDTNGLVVKSNVYMDGNDGDLKGFLDLDSGTIYTASDVASDSDAANSVDFIFYFYTADTTGTFGTPSGVKGSKLTNYSALSSMGSDDVINSTVGYCKALNVTEHASIIAAYNALDYSDSSISALRTSLADFFGTTTYGTSAVYATDTAAATKNTTSTYYALSIETYNYGVYYYPAADKYCVVKILSGETNSNGSVNAVTFDYTYGI